MARAPLSPRNEAAARVPRSPRVRPQVSRSLRSPMYVQVYTTLREWIYEGLYAPGAKLPAESEISAMFGVSRITTRQAIDLLVDERLVQRQQGRGTFVATDLASAPVKGDMDQLLRKVKRLGTSTRVRDAAIEEVAADEDTCKDLGLEAGARVLASMGLSFESWLYHTQLDELSALARAFPDVVVIVDHLGAPLRIGPYADREQEVREVWQSSMTHLASCPNVMVKLGGIGMAALAGERPPDAAASTAQSLAQQWGDTIRWCIDQFGVERCMFESNFPVDRALIGHRDLWNAFKLIVADASADEKAALFRRTADRVYRIST